SDIAIISTSHESCHTFWLTILFAVHTSTEVQIWRYDVCRTFVSFSGTVGVGQIAVIKPYISEVERQIIPGIRESIGAARVIPHAVFSRWKGKVGRNIHQNARWIIRIRHITAHVQERWKS